MPRYTFGSEPAHTTLGGGEVMYVVESPMYVTDSAQLAPIP